MTDLLDAPAGEFEWGPRRRFEALRQKVSQTTLRDHVPEIAMAAGATILIIGGILLWGSFGSSDAAAAPVVAPASTPAQPVIQPAREPYPTAEPEPVVIVHVSGQVAQPGIVEIAVSARVFHAVEAAGGSLANADLDGINLAAPVIDGSQIHVPARDLPEAAEEALPTAPQSAADGPASASPSQAENGTSASPAIGQETATPSTSTDPASPAADQPANPAPASAEAGGAQSSETAPETPVDPWLPEEPNVITPELEQLMEDRATAPPADEVEALLADAGLGEPSS